MRPQQPLSWKRRMARLGIGIVVVYLLCFGALLVFEDSLLYHPARATDGWRMPSAHLSSLQDVELYAGELRLHAWWSPPKDWDKTKGGVLFCHGNAGNLSWWAHVIEAWHEHRSEAFLIFDYPGYGKSEGKPSEAGCYAAAKAAYEWMTETQHVPGQKILLVGQSLGTGVATYLAVDCKHRALVLISPFSSMPDMAAEKFPMFPGRWFVRNRFDNLERIRRCHQPLLLVHGTEDSLVPYHHGETVFAAANEPKRLARLDGVGHHLRLADEFFRALQDLLEHAENPN